MKMIERGEIATARDARVEWKKWEREWKAEENAVVADVIGRMDSEELLVRGKERHVLFDLIPEESWFHKYLEFVKNSESPFMFHLMCAMSVFSQGVGKKRRFYLLGRSIYAPVNTFLVSPAGLARRGEAIEPAVRVGTRAGLRIIQDQASMEGLIGAMEEDSKAMFVAEEASTILSSRDYMSEVPKFLCRLMDCPKGSVERNLKTAKHSVVDPTFNVIFGSAPTWFKDMPDVAVGGGLFSRMLIVYESGKERSIPFPEDVQSEKKTRELEGELVEDMRYLLKRIKEKKLVYPVGKVKNRYKAFYYDNDKSMKNAPDALTHWVGRKAGHLHRVLMNLLVSMGKGWEVDIDTFDRGVALLRLIEENMDQAYRHAGRNVYEGKRQVILDALQRKGGVVEHSVLFKAVAAQFKDAGEFGDCVDSLVDRGAVDVEKVKTKTRPKTVYRFIGGV